MYIFAFMAGILLLVVGILFIMKKDYKDQTANISTPLPTAEVTKSPDYGDLTEDETRIVDQAIGDLLNSGKGITPPMISVASFTARDYADASLDCPQPDQAYAQIITPGYPVVLSSQTP